MHAGSKTLSQEKESLLGYMLTQVVVYNGRKIVVFYVVVAAVGIHDACALDFCCSFLLLFFLQCFDAVGWAAGRASGL